MRISIKQLKVLIREATEEAVAGNKTSKLAHIPRNLNEKQIMESMITALKQYSGDKDVKNFFTSRLPEIVHYFKSIYANIMNGKQDDMKNLVESIFHSFINEYTSIFQGKTSNDTVDSYGLFRRGFTGDKKSFINLTQFEESENIKQEIEIAADDLSNVADRYLENANITNIPTLIVNTVGKGLTEIQPEIDNYFTKNQIKESIKKEIKKEINKYRRVIL